MRGHLVALGLCTMIAFAPTLADAQGCLPGKGNCSSPVGTVSASEPLALWLTGLALIGASFLRRRR